MSFKRIQFLKNIFDGAMQLITIMRDYKKKHGNNEQKIKTEK